MSGEYINKEITSEGLLDGETFRLGEAQIVLALSTTTLTVASPAQLFFTGTIAGKIIQLPDATTLKVGWHYEFYNRATQAVTVQDDALGLVVISPAATSTRITLAENGTAAGIWVVSIAAAGTAAALSLVPLIVSYGANANVGRYLEYYPSRDSLSAPFVVVANENIRAVSLGAESLSTGTLGIFKTTDLVTPIHTVSLTNESRKLQLALSIPLISLDEIVWRITAGTIQKPFAGIYIG